MMTRTQITLDPEMQKGARRRAAELGISLAQYVRDLVAADLGERMVNANRDIVFALGDSGGSDVANHKDAYLGEALSERSPGRRDRIASRR